MVKPPAEDHVPAPTADGPALEQLTNPTGHAATETPASPRNTARALAGSAVRTLSLEERYAPGAMLGKGGMGEVVVAHDLQIGREIALKRILHHQRDHAEVRARFVREARVQAQLEHPSIVPVYDLGVDADGDAWFTMKRVRGETLAQIIARLRAGDAATATRYSRRRLLTAFGSACLALHFAHERGIVHRDLKPENIMLGDFGEVYVLDWGIAKIAGVSDDELALAEPHGAGDGDVTPATELGEVMGTPGYMAPEQLQGASNVGPHSDVWALGSILFELLALEPLLPRRSLTAAIAAMDEDVDARFSTRAPDRDVAVELETACVRATARAPADRYASARALHDDLERYLDGDRDLERRRQLAARHLARVHEAERRMAAGDPDALAQRTIAMQEVNRALALDPTDEQAMHAMVRLLVDPDPGIPPEAEAELAETRQDAIRVAFRAGAVGFMSMYLFLPLYLWMGIRDWTLTGAALGLIATSAGTLYWGSRVPRHAGHALWLGIITSGALVALLTRVVGPLASAPVLAFGFAIGISFNPASSGLRGLIAFVAIALLAPLGLELVGAIDPSYVFDGDGLRLVPHLTELPPTATAVTISATSVATILMLGAYLMRLRATLREAQDRIWAYSWNLQRFLPKLPEDAAHRRGYKRAATPI